MTLIELIIVMAIFSIAMAGMYSSYQVLMKKGVVEFRRAETGIENNIASTVIERDLLMAGYGLADDYSQVPAIYPNNLPRSVSASPTGIGGSDTLTLMGTALGLNSSAAQGWTNLGTVSGGTTTFSYWGDSREDVANSSVVLLMEPTAKQLLNGADWRFSYTMTSTPTLSLGVTATVKSVTGAVTYPFTPQQAGVLLYGLSTSATSSTQPVSTVYYYLSSSNTLSTCSGGTYSLLRAESSTTMTPGNGQPILNCVAAFKVAFGLDTNNDGVIDTWDNGGVTAATYGGVTGPTVLNKNLKQIRVYALVQDGQYDPSYTYSNPNPPPSTNSYTIRVGDLLLSGGTGTNYQLSTSQRSYRWKMLSFAVVPRNVVQ